MANSVCQKREIRIDQKQNPFGIFFLAIFIIQGVLQPYEQTLGEDSTHLNKQKMSCNNMPKTLFV
jgi:hypothetical protein